MGMDYLGPYRSHGFDERGVSGAEHFGSCPLCDDEKHFYVSAATGLFSCKICGEEGNVVQFLTKLHARCLGETGDADYRLLAKQRGLRIATLKRYQLAKAGKTWLIPCINERDTVLNLIRWDMRTGKIYSTRGRPVALFGAQFLKKRAAGCPVWLCEGPWDAIALRGVLNRAVRRNEDVLAVPGAGAFKREWSRYFERRDVFVCYDNDEAGQRGADKAVAKLGAVAKSLKRLGWTQRFRDGYDIRDIIIDAGKTSARDTLQRIEHLLVDVDTASNAASPKVGRPPDDPHLLARSIIRKHYTHEGEPTLRYFHGEWWAWADAHYRLLPAKELMAHANACVRQSLDAAGELSKKVTRTTTVNVVAAMESECVVSGTEEFPVWLGSKPRPGHGDLLAMNNGLLDLEAVLHGDLDVLHKPTPAWFCLTRWPYGYLPKAKCPEWKRFLKEVLPSSASRNLLQEYLGLCLTFDNSHQRFLILVGEGANGKSVVTTVATRLIGPDNVTHVGLERFGDRFAMAPTVGMLANIVSEIGPARTIAEDVLKAITGGDGIQVEFKFQTPRVARPTARLMFATNEIPRFSDRSEAVWRRMIILPFDVAVPLQQQDPKLAERICERELPGIFNWAIVGLRRLRQEGRFTIPQSSQIAHAQQRKQANPAREFLAEQFVAKPGSAVATQALYAEYDAWSQNRGYKPLTEQQLGQDIHRVFPGTERKQRRHKGGRPYFYMGIARRQAGPS